ncbi:MAG: hypothetical protein E5Y00_05415 [Mesorhizobium sp.]|uniref:hypothetical protein n=1 Tax=Mesorhizobium sp. TaxID=1871066 RepID=UPI0011FFB91B|nr:hypothetical protein [Mesorhizobium sp.]TIN82762.1 MAG: hypothetical protein E5X97_29090 [Mesorhizobium sp.]TIO88390.1 MAG: hypothetical protein E5Y00_05415 [Mesorhizobium sp.]
MTLLRSPARLPQATVIYPPHQGKRGGLNSFQYVIDFTAGTAIGGTQPYGSNTNDGRLFRDGTNSVACFLPSVSDGTGTMVSVGNAGLRRSTGGVWSSPSLTNRLLWNRDLTNAAWVISNTTDLTAAKAATGADGTNNAASRITCNVANGTIKQSITLASSQVVFSFMIKRSNGTGTVEFTVDNGTTWASIESDLNGNYQLKFITQAAVTNPVVGIRMGTPGDQISVDFGELISAANSVNLPKRDRVATTTATVLNTQSRPTADIADAAPNTLITAARQPHAFYWQGRSERGNGAGLITGATSMFCTVIANNAVTYAEGSGSVQSADSAFRVGLDQVNKVAGYFTAGGVIKLCVNGGAVVSGTGATADATMDHFDLSTNGAGSRSIYGVTEVFKMGSGVTFTDAELIAMTT